ncbi:peptide synthetase [Methylobacterium sp. ME121]|nr:peptide synthetase [Methylobacterium sp. ME121]
MVDEADRRQRRQSAGGGRQDDETEIMGFDEASDDVEHGAASKPVESRRLHKSLSDELSVRDHVVDPQAIADGCRGSARLPFR